MDAARTEPDETTSLLAHQTDELSGNDGRSTPVRRQKILQKQILVITLVLVLLQSHLVFYYRASGEAKLRRICYEYYKDHNPDKLGPGGRVDWFDCYFEEPIVQRLRHLLNWEAGISSILCESICTSLRPTG